MSMTKPPKSWRDYIDSIDRGLIEADAPPEIRLGICQDVEEYLVEMTQRKDAEAEQAPSLLDPPEAFAAEYKDAVERAEQAESPTRARECRNAHGDGCERRAHICASCFRVFIGCAAYEKHVCAGETADGAALLKPYWSRRAKWLVTFAAAAIVFYPLYRFGESLLNKPSCNSPEHGRLAEGAERYLRDIMSASGMFQEKNGRMPDELRELSEGGYTVRDWVLPGDAKPMGYDGPFAIGRLTYFYAGGESGMLPETPEPVLVYPLPLAGGRRACYLVAYSNGSTRHYRDLDGFLADWEKQR